MILLEFEEPGHDYRTERSSSTVDIVCRRLFILQFFNFNVRYQNRCELNVFGCIVFIFAADIDEIQCINLPRQEFLGNWETGKAIVKYGLEYQSLSEFIQYYSWGNRTRMCLNLWRIYGKKKGLNFSFSKLGILQEAQLINANGRKNHIRIKDVKCKRGGEM